MDFIGRGGSIPLLRRRLGSRAILVCAVALLLCLFGLVGCGSSSSSNGTSGGALPSSSRAASSFVRGNSPTAKQLVLVSAQIEGLYVPPPDVDLAEEGDPDDSLQEARTLAGDGQRALRSSDNDPFDSLVRESQATIDREATGVGLTEEVKLLTDERKSGLDASDFGQEICNAIGAVKGSLSIAQIYTILEQQRTQGSNDVESVIKDGDRRFAQAFGSRFDILDAAQRMVEDIEKLFC
jgi:hypothetical protein